MAFVILALLFFGLAYFAEPIVVNWPQTMGYAKNLRGFVDDFTTGDPNKVINYKMATATITERGFESCSVKYPIKGYLMQTGVKARNEEERLFLATAVPGNGMVIFYDEVNPTIVVMQPTFNDAVRKIKHERVQDSKDKVAKSKDKQKQKAASFVPGMSDNPIVLYLRIGGCIMGILCLGVVVKPRTEEF